MLRVFESREQGQPDRASGTAAPSLSLSNNSNEHAPLVNKLTGGHKRTAFALSYEIQHLAKEFGLERLGFLTLTFVDQVTEIREAQRRFNSLNTGVLKARYSRAIGCVERCKSGRLHFHLVVVLASDIRTGFDFAAIERHDYRSAGPVLRAEWAFLRETLPAYGFGRHELLPVKSTANGIAYYVGKYIAKHVGSRSKEDRGARMVRYIGFSARDAEGRRVSVRRASSRFAWANDNAWLWRQKVAIFADQVGAADEYDLQRLFGKRWAYMLQDSILAIRVDQVLPSEQAARLEMNLRQKTQLRVNRSENIEKERGKVYAKTFQLNPSTRFEPVARITRSDRFGDLDPIGDLAALPATMGRGPSFVSRSSVPGVRPGVLPGAVDHPGD